MRRIIAIFLASLAAAAARAAEVRPPAYSCMTAVEIRQAVSQEKLIQPMLAIRKAVHITRAEPLRSQLCRSAKGLQYRLTLLRRDGRVVRVTLNAKTGVLISDEIPPHRRLKALQAERQRHVAPHARVPASAARLEPENRVRKAGRVIAKPAAHSKTKAPDRMVSMKPVDAPKKPVVGLKPEPVDRTRRQLDPGATGSTVHSGE